MLEFLDTEHFVKLYLIETYSIHLHFCVDIIYLNRHFFVLITCFFLHPSSD